jgi:two-component system sensor histidine kinase QseC
MRSIRVFLVTSIVALLMLFNFVAALQGYQSSMREADTLFDNQMLDLARLVTNLDVSPDTSTALRLGSDLAYQIWQDGELLANSSNAPAERLHEFVPGFDYANFNGYRWRTLARYDAARSRWVFIAERTDLRFVLAENVVLQSILPLLLGIPLVGLLVWMFVTRGLAPLKRLSSELRDKPANDFSAIPTRESRVELEQVLSSINGFVSRLEAAMEREKRFSADAAHELRTPISALKIQLHNLAETVDSRSPAYLELNDGIERMQHLIEQLLSLYRSSPEQFAAHSMPLDLSALVQDVMARLYPVFERKRQAISLEGGGGDELIVLGDRFALETLLSNLLTNASRYTPSEGQVVVALARSTDRISLTVEDSGKGIAEEDHLRIFERFTRLINEQEADAPGCGLGLAIVGHVARLHGAQVNVTQSRFASGARFEVTFPIGLQNSDQHKQRGESQ